MSPEDLAVLKASLKDNPPPHAIHNLEEVCNRTGLDWKLRHCYLIERGGKWRVELSIDGFRAIAGSQPDYDGQDGPYYAMGPEGPWTDIPPAKEPYAAKVGVRRKGQSAPTYATAKYSDYQTGAMYKKFPSTMTAKCAEMLALRKAFPGVLGGLYGAEEMAQAGEKKERAGRTPTPASSASPKSTDAPVAASSSAASAESETDIAQDLYAVYCNKIEECKSLEELTALGSEISKTNMGIELKREVHKVYAARKAKGFNGEA